MRSLVKLKKLSLFKHQKEGLERALSRPSFALFMEQGTGKSAIAIRLSEHRYRKKQIQRVIIFAPNSILYNWELEIQKFMTLRPSQYEVHRLRGKTKKDREIELHRAFRTNNKLNILLLNYEKALAHTKELVDFKAEQLIFDESHKLKSPGRKTKITNTIFKIAQKAATPFRLLMTGTPICNGYEDLFMQYKIMDPSIFGQTYGDFKAQYLVMGGYMGYEIKGYRNVEDIKKVLDETSFRVLLTDCIELPDINFKYYTCELNRTAQKHYNEMDGDMQTSLQNSKDYSRKEIKSLLKSKGVIYKPKEKYKSLLTKALFFLDLASCDLLITKIMRLQQITGGFLTTDNNEVINISKDKLKVLDEILSVEKKTLVFCRYVAEIEMIENHLKGKFRVRSYRDPKTRDKYYKEFKEGKVDVLILQLSSGSVGLNLQEASRVVFYSWSYKADEYVQAISRMKRSGQKQTMEVSHILAEDTIDADILSVIGKKVKLAKKLFRK